MKASMNNSIYLTLRITTSCAKGIKKTQVFDGGGFVVVNKIKENHMRFIDKAINSVNRRRKYFQIQYRKGK